MQLLMAGSYVKLRIERIAIVLFLTQLLEESYRVVVVDLKEGVWVCHSHVEKVHEKIVLV